MEGVSSVNIKRLLEKWGKRLKKQRRLRLVGKRKKEKKVLHTGTFNSC